MDNCNLQIFGHWKIRRAKCARSFCTRAAYRLLTLFLMGCILAPSAHAQNNDMQVHLLRTPSETVLSSQNEVNVASLDAGALVASVSSNASNGPNHGFWGANFALDENPATAWMSNGDGDNAFIDVQLSLPSVPHAVEAWTRSTISGGSQISTFTVTTNAGSATSEMFGPFTLPDKFRAYRFEIAPTQVVNTMRLDVVDSSGGNTGLLSFEVYADLAAVPPQTDLVTDLVQLYLPITLR